jgi:hypothetical protein
LRASFAARRSALKCPQPCSNIKEKFMGDWGHAPYDNDYAADWYGVLFEKTRLAEYVEAALMQDPASAPDDVRAAAFVLVQLGRVYIWPGNDLVRHLQLAIQKLEAIRELDDFREVDGYVAAIDDEIATLRARLQSMRDNSGEGDA